MVPIQTFATTFHEFPSIAASTETHPNLGSTDIWATRWLHNRTFGRQTFGRQVLF